MGIDREEHCHLDKVHLVIILCDLLATDWLTLRIDLAEKCDMIVTTMLVGFL